MLLIFPQTTTWTVVTNGNLGILGRQELLRLGSIPARVSWKKEAKSIYVLLTFEGFFIHGKIYSPIVKPGEIGLSFYLENEQG